MHHGDEVQIIANGIQIAAKALEPIGVFHGSRCWGILVHPEGVQRRPDQAGRQDARGDQSERAAADGQAPEPALPHLLISPIAPHFWPAAFFINAFLQDKPQSLLKASRVLSEQSVNLLFTECGPTGYHHAAWNAVGVAESLFGAIRHILVSESGKTEKARAVSRMPSPNRSNPLDSVPLEVLLQSLEDLSDRERTIRRKESVFSKIGIIMLAYLSRLERVMHDRNEYGDPATQGFLYQDAIGPSFDGSGDRDSHRPTRYFRKRRPWRLGVDCFFSTATDGIDSAKGGEPNRTLGKAAHGDPLKAAGYLDALLRDNSWNSPIKEPTDATSGDDWLLSLCRELAKLDVHKSSPDVKQQTKMVKHLERLTSGTKPQRVLFELWRTYRTHAFEAVRLRAMESLAFFWVFGSNIRNPITFRYDANAQVLRASDETFIETLLRETPSGRRGQRLEIAKAALASIDRAQRFVRLTFFSRPDVDRKLFVVDLRYRLESTISRHSDHASSPSISPKNESPSGSRQSAVESQDPQETGGVSSRGLLRVACETVAELSPEISIRRVTNRITDCDDAFEEGSLRFVAQVGPNENVKDLLPRANELFREIGCRYLGSDRSRRFRSTRIRVFAYPSRRLFVSLPIEFPRRADVVRAVKRACQEVGLMPVIIVDFQKGITNTVREEMRKCHGCLQIITLRSNERDKLVEQEAFWPDFGWLAYEYGLADERGLKPLRIVDKLVPESIRQRYSISRDTPSMTFDSMGSTGQILKSMRDAVTRISRSITEDSPLDDIDSPDN